MKRVGRFAAVVVLLASGVAIALRATPAPAATDACLVQGTMFTANPVFHFGLGPSSSGPFNATAAIGGCALQGFSNWNGNFTFNPIGNYCQHATGVGSFAGNTFSFQWVGDQMVFTGGVTGSLEIQPNSLNGQSCMTGARDFIFTGALVLADGPPPVTIPPVTIPPVTTTSIPAGGPAGPSDTCGGDLGVTNENPVEITAKVASATTTDVCVRAGAFGGKFVISTGGGSLPSIPPVPTTDTNADLCTSTPGNTIGGDHPIVGPTEVDPGNHIFFIDAYASGDQVWVCAKASSTSERLLITLPSGGGLPNPTVTFHADEGTPDPL